MNRRDFCKSLGFGAAALALPQWLAGAEKGEAASAQGKPNIVFILFDDLGYGEPPLFRKDSPFKTPNIGRLATQGMKFTDAHCAAAVCTPTRYGVITGRYPFRIGQYGVLTTYSPPIIEPERLTIGKMLQAQGYHTACIGKWHLGMTWAADIVKKGEKEVPPIGTTATNDATARGFDVFHGYTHARNIGMIMDNNRVAEIVQPIEVQPLLGKKAVEYIDQRAKQPQPFFLYLPLSTPHLPIVPAEEFQGKSGVDAYGDWIFEGDWVVGQVMEALDRNGLADNTLLMVSSDNGAEHREYPPLRGSKRSIYEGGHREPFVARWPGRIRPGSVCDDTICLNDLMATYAEILGVKIPDTAAEDSVSILADLLGAAKGPAREATVHQSSTGDLAIRQGPWKMIFFGTGKKELYNLKDDISETKDLLAEQPEVVERLTELMQKYIDNGRSAPGAPQKNGVKVELGKTEKGGAKAKGEEGAAEAAKKKGKKAKGTTKATPQVPQEADEESGGG
ncbi:MAG: arylsulfatase [Candidatus Sumerlaeota bacterium]|nr:arylsulfatase [Candidatus Sumerlaeota bacterium]